MSLQDFCIRAGTSRYPIRTVTGSPWKCCISRHVSVPCMVIGSNAGSSVGAPAWACICPIGNPGFLTTLELDDHTRPGDRESYGVYKCEVFQHYMAVQGPLSCIQERPLLLGEVHSHVLKGHQARRCICQWPGRRGPNLQWGRGTTGGRPGHSPSPPTASRSPPGPQFPGQTRALYAQRDADGLQLGDGEYVAPGTALTVLTVAYESTGETEARRKVHRLTERTNAEPRPEAGSCEYRPHLP